MRRLRKLAALLAAMSLFLLCFATGCSDGEKPKEPTDILSCNKQEYFDGEEIYVTAKGSGDAWVGVYRDGDDVKKVDPVRYYNIGKNGFVSGGTYALRKASAYSASRQALRNLPRGKYFAALFADAGSNKKRATVRFTVKSDKLQLPSAPQSVEYKLKTADDGLADGKLEIKFAADSYAEEVVLYWADDDGVLSDYTSLAPFFVTGERMTFDMYANTIIPPEATRLLAYGKNSLGVSKDYCSVDLPQGCQYNMGQAEREFAVVSDVHITVAHEHIANTAVDQKTLHDEHFTAMLSDVEKVSPTCGGVFIVGDIANAGHDYEWAHAQEMIDAAGVDVYFTLGNHDLYGGAYSGKAQTFMQYAKSDKVYYEKVIDGYHHFALGSESSSNGLFADLSDAQLNWLDGRLAVITNSEPRKPVFLYLHQSLYNTVAGSFEGQGWDGVVQDAKLRAIIKKYPQIYMFNGHSHWDLNTRGSMHDRADGLPNIFNTSSVGYLWSSAYVPTGEYKKGSQGYYVRVYPDRVLVLGRDFESGKWVPSACFCAGIA